MYSLYFQGIQVLAAMSLVYQIIHVYYKTFSPQRRRRRRSKKEKKQDMAGAPLATVGPKQLDLVRGS